MDYQALLSSARWDIIKAISKGRTSATELAKATKSSLPNVSQQVRLLEAYDLIEYVKDQKTGGKPRQLYGLKRDICHIAFARHGFADKRFFNPDPYHAALINILFIPNMQDHHYLLRFLVNNDDILKHCSVAFLKSNEHELELLIITDELALIRQKYSNTFIEHNGKMRKVVCWSHSIHEINEGLGRKEPYFEHLVQNPFILHDPRDQFAKVKRK